MSGLPREVIKWLQSLDLTHPIRNVRRDFSNGYLVAEVVAWYYPQDIQMHSYSNGTSIQTKLGNWQQLERFFGKEGLDISKEFVEGTIHCKPGAAVALLNRLYVLLTKKELHYCPPKGQPEDFSDKTYQSQLPLHARSTAAQSIKNNIACTELTTEPDSILCMQKAQAIIAAHVQQRNQEKEEFPERFGLNTSGNKSKQISTGTRRFNATETTAEPLEQSLAGIREIKVKQRPPASLELPPPLPQ